jgi:uncharacterized protein
MTATRIPLLGAGVGYRRALHDQILAHQAEIDWLEIITGDFLPLTAARHAELEVLTRHFVCVPHGLDLSAGGTGPLDDEYLSAVCELAGAVSAPWLSDRRCFPRGEGFRAGHHAGTPRTREAARWLAARARQVQSWALRPFLIENLARESGSGGGLTEAQFLCEVLYRSDCWLLLDVNNVHANWVSHRIDPYQFLDQIPLERVLQIHLAHDPPAPGGREDTSDAPVPELVWELADYVISRTRVRGVLLERDPVPDDVAALLGEVGRARVILGPGDEALAR